MKHVVRTSQRNRTVGTRPPLTSVKEHVTNDSGAPVNFERVSTEYNPLQHNTLRITAEQAAGSHKVLDALNDKTTKIAQITGRD